MKRMLFALCLCLLLSSCEQRDVIHDAPPAEPILTLAQEEQIEMVEPVTCRLTITVKVPEVDKYRDIPLSHELQDVALAACEEYGVLPDVLYAVMEVESDVYESCVLAQELQKGYTYDDMVVRLSMVGVVE